MEENRYFFKFVCNVRNAAAGKIKMVDCPKMLIKMEKTPKDFFVHTINTDYMLNKRRESS